MCRSEKCGLFGISHISFSIQRFWFASAIERNRIHLFWSSWAKNTAEIALLSPAAVLTFHRKGSIQPSIYLSEIERSSYDIPAISCVLNALLFVHFGMEKKPLRFFHQSNPTAKRAQIRRKHLGLCTETDSSVCVMTYVRNSVQKQGKPLLRWCFLQSLHCRESLREKTTRLIMYFYLDFLLVWLEGFKPCYSGFTPTSTSSGSGPTSFFKLQLFHDE